MKKQLALLLLTTALALTACDDEDSKPSPDHKCSPDCKENQTCSNGTCVDKEQTQEKKCSPDCKENQTCSNGTCVDKEQTQEKKCSPDCKENQTCSNGTCVDKEQTGKVDPCTGVTCTAGTCDEGVCVTNEMKALEADTICDPETFVEFCNGETPVYCDNGIVKIGDTPCGENKCVVYTDTTFARPRKRATCSEGSCTTPNEIHTSCEFIKGYGSTVYATACQRTTRNTLETVNIDGYFCNGSCDATNTKCELTEDECHPYEFVPSCDGQQLTTCFKTSTLHFVTRQEFCSKDCISINSVNVCALGECTELGTRKNYCGYVDSVLDKDQVDTICVKADDNKMYQVRTGEYAVCNEGCNTSTGECK